MKTQSINASLLVVLVCFAATVSANEPGQDEPPQDEDTILGTWYPQPKTGQFPMGDHKAPAMRFIFEADGVYKLVINEQELVGKYRHDAEQQTIAMLNGDGEVASEVTYAFQGEVLLLTSKIDENREDVAEYTRNPEGTERHQKMRKERFHAPSREAGVKSMVHMRRIFQAQVAYANGNHNTYPKNVGLLLELEFIKPEQLLTPWGQAQVPDGFEEWETAEQVDWANRKTGYLFLLGGKEFKLDPERLVLVEMPTDESPKTVSVMFEDGQGKVIAYDEADNLIKNQTGQSIAQWKKSKSPGSGAVPENKPEK